MLLDILFTAKVFAVVGASQDEHKVGHQIFKNLKSNSNLLVFPVNPKGGEILKNPVYESLSALPKPPEVVVIAVPYIVVPKIVDDCIKAKVQAVILISAGFAEAGESGKQIQDDLSAKLKTAGILLLGPNSMGYVAPSENIFASFGPQAISKGPIMVISQSGAMLSAIFQEFASAQTGISKAISLGNRTGISENDALEFAVRDPDTQVVAIYLESLKDPRELLRIGQKCSRHKPIFLLKGGTTEEGRQAAASHTAALATSQVLLNDLCLQAGIVQVHNFEQLVRASSAAAQYPTLGQVHILTNAGGPAVVLVDELSQLGLKVSAPTDLLGDATANEYAQALAQITSSDTCLVVITEQAVTDIAAITQVLIEARKTRELLVCLAGGDELDPYRKELHHAGIVATRFPNELAEIVIALQASQTQLNSKPQIPHQYAPQNPYPKSYTQLVELLSKYHLVMPTGQLIANVADLSLLSPLKFPLIAKTTNLTILHKAKVGAVVQDILDHKQAASSYHLLTKWGSEVLFQEKVTKGIEVLLGAHHDPFWGWYMAVGLGGSLSDTYDDRAYIFLPATPHGFAQAVNRTNLAKLLTPAATHQLLSAMSELQNLALTTTGLTEIEINPLFVKDQSVLVADLKRS